MGRWPFIAILLGLPALAVAAEGGPGAPIAPKSPQLPAVTEDGPRHPIDRLLQPYYEKHGVELEPVVSDRLFARRVHLDLIGLLPTPEQMRSFLKSEDPDKRRKLVEKLLADDRAYTEHWLTFWNDALRNAYRGAGFIDGGREQITRWLYRALRNNKPYDRFVSELVESGQAEGFTKGIQWRGVVNASQVPEMQTAQTVGQVFLGVNLKCASCHDSFVDDWELEHAYNLASTFAEEPLEVHRCNKPQGETAKAGFLWPQVDQIDPDAPRKKRQKQLAASLTSERNGRFTRTIVNRLWAKLMGRGLVEPIDEMAYPAWHPKLLNWLAADLRKHGYDLKHTLKRICTSRAYQLRSVPAPASEPEQYVFRGPRVRRMNAEQFVDAVSAVTGVWQDATKKMRKRDGRGQGGQLKVARKATGHEAAGSPGATRGIRASLADNGALMRALGRPNREQVVTRRESRATTLQALELTNGATLNRMLAEGAKRWLEQSGTNPDAEPEALIEKLYFRALGREPTDAEIAAARQLVGDPPDRSGLQDLMWAMAMKPEFQLIR